MSPEDEARVREIVAEMIAEWDKQLVAAVMPGLVRTREALGKLGEKL